ncbi:MAG: hypothetical protein OXC96_10325 [Cyanobacteria bacterium MAG CAR1_bin_15]|nr:hypothetical protein [Cyanobacteria bacterium MAG CAR1_bin_15]
MPSLPPELLTQWLQPGALVAGAVGGLGLLISAFRNLRTELKEEMKELKQEMRASEDRLNKRIDEVKTEMKEEMRASEERVNRRIDEVKEEMREVKQEMKELKALLIQALQLSPEAKP